MVTPCNLPMMTRCKFPILGENAICEGSSPQCCEELPGGLDPHLCLSRPSGGGVRVRWGWKFVGYFLLGTAAINGREPRLIILVTVREAFLHCGKALKRSRLWQEDYRIDKRSFPSLGRMIVEQTKPATVTVEQADAFVEENYVTGLY